MKTSKCMELVEYRALSKLGIKARRYKVRRLMSELGLKVRYPKKFKVTTDSGHNDAISPNKLDRQLQLKLRTRCGRLISATFGHLKAGFMWLL